MANFNAVKAYQNVKERYMDFLLDRTCGAFPNPDDEAFWNASRNYLSQIWNSDNASQSIFAKPVVEGLFPYESCGKSNHELIETGILAPQMASLMNNDYCLYRHQLEALENIAKSQNIVVSSGTGSGKTECFLYPILNQLLKEGEGLQQPGVRALMIYPMNALVKDQLKRIVTMLTGKNLGIRVGMFTSQTYYKTPQRGGRNFRKLAEWEQKGIEDGCYVCSRADLRQERTLPHILITNYSMMEYMMLRHKDNIFFDFAKLHSIVLDEVHLYSGTLGSDINMLIRRVLLRYGKAHHDIRFYATSATIGDGKPETLQTVAANIFGVPLETVTAITGERTKPQTELTWPEASDEDKRNASAIRQKMYRSGQYMSVNNDELNLLGRMSESAVNKNDNKPYFPYKLHVFFNSPRFFYSDLQLDAEHPMGNLQSNPIFPHCTGIQVFSTNQPRKDFYFKASFFQSPNNPDAVGLYSAENTHEGDKIVYFRRRTPQDGGLKGFSVVLDEANDQWFIQPDTPEYPGIFVFALKHTYLKEILDIQYGTSEWCSFDGRPLKEFSGNDVQMDDDNDVGGIQQDMEYHRYRNSDPMLMPLGFVPSMLRTITFTELLFSELSDAPEQEHNGPWNSKQMLLFSDSRSGAAEKAAKLQSEHQRNLIRSYIYNSIRKQEEISIQTLIDRLEDTTGLVQQFALPQNYYLYENPDTCDNLVRSWLIPSLVYQELGLRRTGGRNLESFNLIEVKVSRFPDNVYTSDRWLALRENIKRNDNESPKEKWEKKILPRLIEIFRETSNVFIRDIYDLEREKDILMAAKRRVGRLAQANKALFRKCLSQERLCWNAIGGVFNRFKAKNSMCMKRVLSPQNEKLKAFLDMFFRNDEIDDLHRNERRGEMWQQVFDFIYYTSLSSSDEDQAAIFFKTEIENQAPGLALDLRKLIVKHTEDSICLASNQTNRLTSMWELDARDVTDCLQTSYDFQQAFENRNFETDPVAGGIRFSPEKWGGLRVPEHSAQLQPLALSAIEESFKKKEINVISCTPTMEVGVDIGGLDVVLQGNLPPEKANYLQRSGRAGRNGQATALNVTLLGNSLFDSLTMNDSMDFFNRRNLFAPADVVSEEVREQVIQHVQQFMIGEYFHQLQEPETEQRNGAFARRAPDDECDNPVKSWDSVGNFLGNRDSMQNYKDYLDNLITDLQDIVSEKTIGNWQRTSERIQNYLVKNGTELPRCTNMQATLLRQYNDNVNHLKDRFQKLVEGTILENYDFSELLAKLQSNLNSVADSFNADLQNILNQRQLYRDNDRLMTALKFQFTSLYGKTLISYLINKRILPAYGFPTNVVSFYAGKETLERDKFDAINEFIPGSAHTIAHEKYTVDALVADYRTGNDANTMFNRKFLLKCPKCGHAWMSETYPNNEIRCDHCNEELIVPNEQSEKDDDEREKQRCKITSYVQPAGYRSMSVNGLDAAASRKGMIWTLHKDFLLYEPPAMQRRQEDNRPAPASFMILDNNMDNHAIELCVNYGAFGYGYIIGNKTGRVISKHSNKDNDQDDQNWENNPTSEFALEGGENESFTYSNLACDAKVNVWVCMFPIWNPDETDLLTCEALKTVIGLALQLEAASMLGVDTRTFSKYIRCINPQDPTNAAVHFCLYDKSGAPGLIRKIRSHQKDILRNALQRIIRTGGNRGSSELLNYTTARDLASLTNQEFQKAVEWVKEHFVALTSGQYNKVCGLSVEQVTKLANKLSQANECVTLLYPEISEAIIHGDIIRHLIESKVPRIRVVFKDYSGNSETDDDLNSYIRYNLNHAMITLMESNRRGEYCRLEFCQCNDNDFWKCYDEKGIRLSIGNQWYLWPKEEGEETFCLAGKRYDELDKCYLVQESNPYFSIAQTVISPMPIPQTMRNAIVCEVTKGTRYIDMPTTAILNKLAINPNEMIIKKVEYNDGYFLKVHIWRTFIELMKNFRFTDDAEIRIYAGNDKDINDGYKLQLNERPLFSLPWVNWCKRSIDSDLAKNRFAPFASQSLGVPVTIEYLSRANEREHKRLMVITYGDNQNPQNEKTLRLYFDKGMDFLDFEILPYGSYRIFDPSAMLHAKYSGNYYFVKN